MESAMKNKKPSTYYEFYIQVDKDNISDTSLARFEKFKKKYSDKCDLKIIKKCTNYEKYLRKGKWWTRSTFFRLDIHKDLDESIKKAIYIDCDTLVMKDLSDLFSIELGDNYCGGVIDRSADDIIYWLNELGYNDLDFYINSGVLLLNLEKWRADKVSSRISKFLEEHYKELRFVDQDVINILFAKKIKKLSIDYNLPFYILDDYDIESPSIKKHYNKSGNYDYRSNCVIIHYLGQEKPWKNKDVGSYKLWHDIYKEIKKYYGFNNLSCCRSCKKN